MNKAERKFLNKAVKKVRKGGFVVEVGSFYGDSSTRALATGIESSGSKASLYCVDPFDEKFYQTVSFENVRESIRKRCGSGKVIDEFRKNMAPYPYTLIQKKSVDAAEDFLDGSIDFIFIDGNHSYEDVLADISAWYPKVKTGGVMCGHDYGKPEFGVTEAVHEFFLKANNPARSIWHILKVKAYRDD